MENGKIQEEFKELKEKMNKIRIVTLNKKHDEYQQMEINNKNNLAILS